MLSNKHISRRCYKIKYGDQINDIVWLKEKINVWINGHRIVKETLNNYVFDSNSKDYFESFNKYLIWKHINYEGSSKTYMYFILPDSCWDSIKLSVYWNIIDGKVRAKYRLDKNIYYNWIYPRWLESNLIFQNRIELKIDNSHDSILNAGDQCRIKHLYYPEDYKVHYIFGVKNYFESLFYNTRYASQYNVKPGGIYKLYYLYRETYKSRCYKIIDYEEITTNRFTVKEARMYKERVSLWIVYQSSDHKYVRMSRAIPLYYKQEK